MKELAIIEGEMSSGKGGTGSYTPVEANDTLASRNRVHLLFAISEGEIEEVSHVYLNQILLGTYDPFSGNLVNNFNASWDWRPGTANQTVLPGFILTETPLTTFSPTVIHHGVDYPLAIPFDVNSVTLTFTLDSLREVKGNGDITGYTVTLGVYTRPNSSATWTYMGDVTKSGKASNPYSWSRNYAQPVGVTSASYWEVKVVRISPDDTLVNYNSVVNLSSVILIYDTPHTYPNTALVALHLYDASQFGGSIPEITFRSKGKKVKIPSNYDPIAHTYIESPPWDGTLTENIFYYTANPAWHIYYILNTSLNISRSDIDVISLYQLSKYCDGQVDNGQGGLEYRYELHNQFTERVNVPTFLMYLLSICNANFTTNEFGQISVMFDRAGQAVSKQVTNANVIDGLFSYSSNDLESRSNLVNVTYNNSLYFGKSDVATVYDDGLISRYSLQPLDIMLPGCISQAQAMRKGRWAVYTNSELTGMVTYRIMFGGLTYSIGELVRVYDNDNQGNSQAGIIINTSYVSGITTITLDRPITLANQAYTFYCLGFDGITDISNTIHEFNTTTSVITITGQVIPANNTIFTLSGQTQPKIYKVIKIDKSDELYTITCVDHSELKYSYIETGVIIDIPQGDFVNITEFTTVPVDAITVQENFASDGVVSLSTLHVMWAWPSSGTPKYKATYKATWKRDNQQAKTINNIMVNGFDIADPVPGVYEITVWAVNPLTNITSTPVTYIYNFRIIAGTSTLIPPENIFVEGTSGLIFNSPELVVTFTYPVANDSKRDTLLDYIVEVWDITTTNKKGVFIVPEDSKRGGRFVLPFITNVSLFGTPTRQFNLKIFSRDTIGDVSIPVQVTVNNPVPALTNWTAIASFNAIYVHITPSTELDVKEYIVYASPTPNFIKDQSTLVYAGPDVYNNFSVLAGTTMYYAISIADSFGRAGSLISTEQNATSISADPDTFTYTGINFHPNNPSTNKVTWDAATATKTTPSGVSTTWNIIANPIGVTWTAGILYIYYIPGDTVLTTGTSLVAAIAAGGRILGTYKGGADMTADQGRAFISGDQILAGTVGANNLVTNTAVITNAAQIGNIIESSTYSYIPGGSASGWRIDKTGWAQFSSITITNSAGQTLLSSNTGMEWGQVTGAGKPANNADVTSANVAAGIAGQGTFATLNQITPANVSTYIAGASITNAYIGDTIQSTNYSAGAKTGWLMDKTGNITTYGTFMAATAGTGLARTENTGDVIRVYDSAGILRVKLGNLA